MGKTVNREILSDAVHRAVGLTGHESKTLVSQVIEGIATTLERGETVKLSSFGSFVVRPTLFGVLLRGKRQHRIRRRRQRYDR
jgi:hypothetical protein